MGFEGPIFVCAALVLIALMVSLAIPSLIYAYDPQSNACAGTFGGISFTYGTFLAVSGWVTIAQVVGVLVALLSLAFHEVLAPVFSIIAGVLVIGGGLLQLPWYIVGAILYFTTIKGHCPDNQPITEFGLALFIIQSVTIAMGICGGGGSSTQRN